MKLTPNNFDLIRLLAASQVMFAHAIEHTETPVPYALRALLDIFPGVPVFFVISGFLIYQSYAKAPDTREYLKNRALRLYPGLIACFILSVAAVFAVGYLTNIPKEFPLWTVAQLSCVQFYNPEFMRGFGVGVLNGSLWTVSVELQFYILTPALHAFADKRPRRFLALITVFLALNLLYIYSPQESIGRKLYPVTFLPWFYMFLLGAYLSTRPALIEAVRGKVYLLFIYVVAAYALRDTLPFGNRIIPVFSVLLIASVFALAYYREDTSNRILNRNDISYGVYIYHMPVINVLLYMGAASVWAAAAFTFTLAALSWFMIERPTLAMKRVSLRPITLDQTAANELTN